MEPTPRATLARLVGYPTISDRPVTAIGAWLAQVAEDQGLTVERFESPDEDGKFNLVARIGPPGTDGLVLSGHMDVVPVDGQPWSTDPFTLTERDDRLYGRGAADMKGFLAAAVHALARIPTRAFRRELVLVWTHDEEVGCLGSQLLARDLAARERALPSACWIGEPTGFRILRAHPGHVAMELAFTGRAAHSSRPDLGVNAIEAAADAVAIVRRIAAELEQETAHEDLLERPWVAVNTALVEGGSAINIVPDRCTVQIGYRPLPGMPAERVYERIRDQVADGLRTAPAGVEARLIRVTPALLTDEGTPLQALLAPHATDEPPGAAPFATDGGNLARVGCQPLVFGPGSIEVAHQADEYLDLAALERAVDVAEAVVRARCT